MTSIFVSIGSNIEPHKNISRAVLALKQKYRHLKLSPVYESLAVGFSGDNFLNMVVAYDSEDSVRQVAGYLKEIEQKQGRGIDSKGFKPRVIDLDLLLYGDAMVEEDGIKLPRDEIRQYAFVLRPLADIFADGVDPVTGNTYGRLWAEFQDPQQELWPVQMEFEG